MICPGDGMPSCIACSATEGASRGSASDRRRVRNKVCRQSSRAHCDTFEIPAARALTPDSPSGSTQAVPPVLGSEAEPAALAASRRASRAPTSAARHPVSPGRRSAHRDWPPALARCPLHRLRRRVKMRARASQCVARIERSEMRGIPSRISLRSIRATCPLLEIASRDRRACA